MFVQLQGYSDACSLLSSTVKPYRQLFFPQTAAQPVVQAAQLRTHQPLPDRAQYRIISPKFTGLDWEAACQQPDFPPPALVLTWQLAMVFAVLPFAAWQARMYGRKAAVITGCCLQAVGVILKALSWHLAQLLVGYGLEGLGRGILWLVSQPTSQRQSPTPPHSVIWQHSRE